MQASIAWTSSSQVFVANDGFALMCESAAGILKHSFVVKRMPSYMLDCVSILKTMDEVVSVHTKPSGRGAARSL